MRRDIEVLVDRMMLFFESGLFDGMFSVDCKHCPNIINPYTSNTIISLHFRSLFPFIIIQTFAYAKISSILKDIYYHQIVQIQDCLFLLIVIIIKQMDLFLVSKTPTRYNYLPLILAGIGTLGLIAVTTFFNTQEENE